MPISLHLKAFESHLASVTNMAATFSATQSPIFSPSHGTLLSMRASSTSPDSLSFLGSPSSSSSPPSSCSFQSPLSPFSRRSNKLKGFLAGNSGRDCPNSTPTLLKRKRPASISIPLSSSVSDQLIESTSAGPEEVEIENDRFSVFCKRGKRRAMEDRHSAVLDIFGDPKQAFFGVFDGHGGARAAEFVADNIYKNIIEEVVRRGDDEIVEALRNGYHSTDADFVKEGACGGTCCVTVLLRNGRLIVSHAGDCRAVLSRGGMAESLTKDHRPSRDDERERIQRLGGYVDNCNGIWRLQGCLAVSRAIGDSHFKQWVVPDPETKILTVETDFEFVILASDGLWEKVSDQEAVNQIRAFLDGASSFKILAACKKLVELSRMRGSTDDISVMIVNLDHFKCQSRT